MECTQGMACVIQCLSSGEPSTYISQEELPRSLLWRYMGLIHSLGSGPWAHPWQKEAGGGGCCICLETSSPSYFHHPFSLNLRVSDVTSDLVQASFLS